jgi:hypothetical protein
MAPRGKASKRRRGGRRNGRRKARGSVKGKMRGGKVPSAQGWGEVVTRGVRSLVSLIPGATAFKDLADIAFRAIGIGTVTTVSAGQLTTYTAVASMYGLGSCFLVSLSSILVGSSVVLTPSGDDTKVITTYGDGRMIRLTVRVMPTNALQKRQGMWSISITPFRAAEDEASFAAKRCIPKFDEVSRRPGAVSGPAARPLNITYSPSVLDGFAYQYHPLETRVCMVCIAFEDYARTDSSVGNFTPEDVMPEVTLSGEVGLLKPDVSGYTTYYGGIISNLPKGVEYRIKDFAKKKEYYLAPGTTTTMLNGKLQVSGITAIIDATNTRYVENAEEGREPTGTDWSTMGQLSNQVKKLASSDDSGDFDMV